VAHAGPLDHRRNVHRDFVGYPSVMIAMKASCASIAINR
jgi:hypothetical protein